MEGKLFVSIFAEDVLLEKPAQTGGSHGGTTEAHVERVAMGPDPENPDDGSVIETVGRFPCHVELVPMDRVRRWCSESEDFDGWLSGNEPGKLRTVEIDGKPYVLFVTPFA